MMARETQLWQLELRQVPGVDETLSQLLVASQRGLLQVIFEISGHSQAHCELCVTLWVLGKFVGKITHAFH